AHPSEVESLVPTLNKILGVDQWIIGFTHPTEDLDNGRLISSYKELPTMLDKVKEQLKLADQIVAVNAADVAVKVLSTHILRDLVGNLRTFTSQRVRCMRYRTKILNMMEKGKTNVQGISEKASLGTACVSYHITLLLKKRVVAVSKSGRAGRWTLTKYGQAKLFSS